MTHTESFERFCAQPIGRAKLYLIDYAQTKANKNTRDMLSEYLAAGSTLSIRTFAANVETDQPNAGEFQALILAYFNKVRNA